MSEKSPIEREGPVNRISTEFVYTGPGSFPRKVIFEDQEFHLRHKNPEKENAVYDRFVGGADGAPREVELLIIDKNGGVVTYVR